MNLLTMSRRRTCPLVAGRMIALTALLFFVSAAAAQTAAANKVSPADPVGVGKQKLNGYRRPDFADAPLVGPLEPTGFLSLAIGLPVRDPSALEALVLAVSDPQNPSYRKFLTPEETISQFSPAISDYVALAAFAQAHGLKVARTYDNRYLLDVSGTVEVVEKAFHVKLNRYRRPDRSEFFAPDREPSLDLAAPILFIAGLENFVLPHGHHTPFQGSGPFHLLNSVDLRKIYTDNNTTLYGQGETVGLLELAAPDHPDIYGNGTPGTGYAGTAGLPTGLGNPSWPVNTTAPPLLVWPVGSTASVISSQTTPDELQSINEAVLDVEMSMAMAPALDKIVAYVATQNPATNFSGQIANAALIDSALNAMVSPPPGYPRPRQISASLNWLADPNAQQILKTMAVQHQSFFASSGDLGAYNAPGCTTQQFCYTYGANTYCNDLGLADVTLVGGTLFSATVGSPYDESEIAWSPSGALPAWPYLFTNLSSGGGIINGVPLPRYQTGLTANGASTAFRNSPDVAAAADGLYYYFNGGSGVAAGTSASAPLWAGFTALVNQQRQNLNLPPGIGFLNPTLYSLASSNYSANFHDVIAGNNGHPADPPNNILACAGFNAGTGYDLVTGLGSPTGQLIVNLAGAPITAANEGDPHITTVDGVHYDFQGAGEFVALRDSQGFEIQTRQTPIPTAAPVANAYTGLATCVSLNTAVAARVGPRRVTYQPNLRGDPDPSGLQLRVDGVLTTLPANGLDLGAGGRVIKSAAGPGVIEIDFPDGSSVTVSPTWWEGQSTWYLNVLVFRPRAKEGIMGAVAPGSWLPALANGTSLGPWPAAISRRYADLYQTFADSWRVTNATSLFDYAPGTSTATFTVPNWPAQNSACVVPKRKAGKPMALSLAQRLGREIVGKNRNADCVFDMAITGEPGFVNSYLLSQRIEAGSTMTRVNGGKDPTQAGDRAAFTATVALKSPQGNTVPAGMVQFLVDGKNAGAPAKLDAKGQAVWRTVRLTVGQHRVAARFIPAKESGFLASTSFDLSHSVLKEAPGR